ncbi:MAG: C-GCAxxG-C-C family protein [Dehalococcoidia bacterium]|jgi:C_GCAxxG_C_C family probable redox protein
MPDYAALKRKVDELAAREWDEKAIAARVNKLAEDDIPRKRLDPKELLANKEQFLEQLQRRAEEYNFMLKNCAQSTALTLLEGFGLGNMDIIKALTPFPGIGGSGEICGGISGSLIALGLFFGSDDPLDYEAKGRTIGVAQEFMALFEEKLGFRHCARIIEKVTIGHKINPGDSAEAMAAFAREKGFEKCGLPPGTGVRLAAGIIIDSMQQ